MGHESYGRRTTDIAVCVASLFFCEAIGTAATPGLLCQPRVIMKIIMEKQMECRLAGETEVLGENLLQRHFWCSQPYAPCHCKFATVRVEFTR
jgi:hypothetical protein